LLGNARGFRLIKALAAAVVFDLALGAVDSGAQLVDLLVEPVAGRLVFSRTPFEAAFDIDVGDRIRDARRLEWILRLDLDIEDVRPAFLRDVEARAQRFHNLLIGVVTVFRGFRVPCGVG
jgi:hypothetical protein